LVSKDGTKINADVNGAANIMRKVVPDAFANGIAGLVASPLVVTLYPRNPHFNAIA
jgi:putative transposase